MLRVLFFAKIKEDIGFNYFDLKVDLPTSASTIRHSLSYNFPENKSLFSEKNSIVAINQEIANSEKIIKKGDEVAFFPPVTGG